MPLALFSFSDLRFRTHPFASALQALTPAKLLRSGRSLAVLLAFGSVALMIRAQAPAAASSAGAAPAAMATPSTASSVQAGSQAATAPISQTVITDANATTGNSTRDGNNSTQRNEASQRLSTPVAQPEPLSQFQELVASTTGRILPIFGESLFNGVPSTFAPVEDVPVSGSYVLGPGDEVNISLSGQVNQRMDLRVDRTGAIQVPGIGSVQVAGIPYGQLREYLTQQFGRIYRGFTLNTQLGQLRTIQIFVVGQARRPGSYSISSLSTLLNAIFASGGPAADGSVRDIEVKRNGVVIDHFDLYDLLLRGDKTRDITLQSGDIIFFPYVGPQFAVLGAVDQSAIYEMKGETTISQAIALAGGFTTVAAPESVRLDRVLEHRQLSISDIPLATGGTTPLANGDIITVASIVGRFADAVTLRGNVANPGRYVWHPDMRLADLFPDRDSLITRGYWQKRNALGQIQQDYIPGSAAVDAQEGSLSVRANDTDRQSLNSGARGNVGGSSQAGGSSTAAALTANNSPFAARTDVVLSAPDIDWSYAVIERLNMETLQTSLIPFNLGKLVLDHDPSQNLALLPGDIITVFSKADITVPASQQTRFVRLEGEFNASGVYSVLPGETLRSLVARAGGFTPDAYLYASEFTRESTRRVEQQRRNEIADSLDAQISSATSSNTARAVTAADQQAAVVSAADARAAVVRLRSAPVLGRITLNFHPDSQGIDQVPEMTLEDGDRFVVPRVPSDVFVQGEVYSATAFLYAHGQRVSDYLKRAGGPNRDSDRKRIYVVRASGDLVSRQYADVLHAPVYPGDTIVVPPTLDRRSVLQRVTNVATIIGNVGLAVAALYVLSR